MRALFATILMLTLGLPSGCKTHLEPTFYSPNYERLVGADGRVELLPAECLKPSSKDEFGAGKDFVPLLAPGCANNLTLMQIVEQREDLFQGRVTGLTMAAPVGRAAQVYIDGNDREEQRPRQDEQQSSADKQEKQ
ncbi:hypothetical protein [Pseudomonas sp. LB1P83]